MQGLLERLPAAAVERPWPAWAGGAPREPDRAGWRDETWTALVGGFDRVLRRCQGVHEFSPDPRCVLRVGLRRAGRAVVLADGTRLLPGAPVGVIHFWNEHLPRFPRGGPDLHWAKAVRCRVEVSLSALADHAVRAPAWRDVQAIQGGIAVASVCRTGQMQHVAASFGFELVEAEPSGLGRAHAFAEDFLLWGFARAFNPAALHRQPFFRPRREIWMSRATLLRRFGRPSGCASSASRPRGPA